MKSAHIQSLSVCGFSYIRVFAESYDPEAIEKFKTQYSYIALYSYTKLSLPGFSLTVQETPIIDLSKSLGDIFKEFRRDTRNGIHRTEVMPKLRFEIPARDIHASYAFYEHVKRKDGIAPDLEREFLGCFFGDAYLDNRLIVSMSFYDDGISLRSKHIVSLRKEMDKDRNISAYATRRLVWEFCKYAKEKGYEKIDLGGVNFSDIAKKTIADFKLSFTENIGEIYIYRYQTKLFSALKKGLSVIGKNIH